MIDLNKAINDSLAKIESENYVQEVVDKKIKKTIESIIDDLLSAYGNFGKNLKTEIESNLNINLKELDIPGYNLLVLNAVKEKLNQVTTVQGIEKINEAMDKMLVSVKPEYMLSEVVEALRDHEKGYRCSSDRMTLFIEESSSSKGYVDIYLDSDKKNSKYSCDYQIRIDPNGKVWNAKMDGRDFDKNKEFGALFGVGELLFKIYATGAKLTVDQDIDDYNLSYHREEDY